MDDLKAFERIQDNDTVAFKYLFDKYYERLCDFALLYVHSTDASADLVTEFFIKFWNQRDRIHVTRSLRSFIYKSVKNASLNYLRTQRRQMLNYEDYHEVLVSTDLSPQEQMEFQEFQHELETFTQSLPDRRKLILTLRIKAGLSNKEIADTLAITESTVKNQLCEAMGSIRTKFKLKK